MKIARDLYLNRLVAGRENGLIIVVTGIRRCGKSYLLFILFYDYHDRSKHSKSDDLTVFNGGAKGAMDC